MTGPSSRLWPVKKNQVKLTQPSDTNKNNVGPVTNDHRVLYSSDRSPHYRRSRVRIAVNAASATSDLAGTGSFSRARGTGASNCSPARMRRVTIS